MVNDIANSKGPSEYWFGSAAPAHNHSYLVPGVLKVLGPGGGRRAIDLGCGNGSLTSALAKAGFKVVGLDSSTSGIAHATQHYPEASFEYHDLSTPLPAHMHEGFDVVLAAEVIEHLFLPRQLFARASEAIKQDGSLVVTTPFHGYLKNIALAVTNRCDAHWGPGWDYGHIKFFSKATLAGMATECGFQPVEWEMVGRVPHLAKSMIMHARMSAVLDQ